MNKHLDIIFSINKMCANYPELLWLTWCSFYSKFSNFIQIHSSISCWSTTWKHQFALGYGKILFLITKMVDAT